MFSFPLRILPLLLILALLPFFEGCETAIGLFLVHTLILFALLVAIYSYSSIVIPRFLIYFLPFGAALILSTLIAPYKYSAFLQLWDYCIAGLFAITVFTVFKSESNQTLARLFPFFFIAIAGIAVSLIFGTYPGLRVHGTFPNPNDFSSLCLLCLILGVFLLEQSKDQSIRISLIVCVVGLMLLIAFSSSRGAFIATLLFALLYILQRKPGKVMSVCILVALLVSSGTLIYRFTRYPDPFQYYRLKIWKNSLKGILSDPYLGVGLNMLRYNASRFNFPADVELGRFAKVARTADNQYLQILVETGFLGLFTFLVGWCAIYFFLRKAPTRFVTLRNSIFVISVLCLFSLPLNNTAITLFFLFVACLPLCFQDGEGSRIVRFRAPGRVASAVILFALFAVAVFLPYAADREYGLAIASQDSESARDHLERAVFYNPYQPYYRFVFARRMIDSRANLDTEHWLYLVRTLNDAIALNPLEPDFYLYRARIFRALFNQTHHYGFYTQAISSYQAALDKSPYNVFFRAELAGFEAKLGRFSLAQDELEKALDAEPVFLNARLMLIEMEIEQNDRKSAQQEIQKLEEYRNRYRNFVPVDNPMYIRALLAVDPNRIEQVKKAVYSN